MKTTKWNACLAMTGLLLSLPASAQERQDLPSLKSAEVTIPYVELKQLWEAARRGQEPRKERASSKPPVTAVINSAEYELNLSGEAPTLTAIYQVTSLSADWEAIPLLGGDARLVSAETGEASLISVADRYCLMTNAIGTHKLVLQLALPQPSAWTDGLRLCPEGATLNQLRIAGLPEGKTITIPGILPTTSDDESATFHLPGKSTELTLALGRREKIVAPPEPAPPTPSTWDIQSEVFVQYHEGRIHYDCAIYSQSDDGSGLSMELLLPHNALGLQVNGEDLAKNRLGARQDGLRPLHIDWNTRDILDRKLQLSYQVPQSPLESDWQLHAPRVAGDGSTKSLFAIVAVDGLEIRGEPLRDSVQSRRLPEWLRARIALKDFFTAEAADTLTLGTTWLPRVETAQAMVSQAIYQSRVGLDGTLLVHAEFTIQHQSPMSWRVSLPEIDQILSCEINDSAAQPVRRGDHEIEFSLNQPTKGSSKVGFCFTAQAEAFDPVSGRLALTMPKTDLFIHELTWELSIPAEYEAEIQGNVVINRNTTKTVRPPHLIPLKKELVRGEHPAVEVYYQRRGLSH